MAEYEAVVASIKIGSLEKDDVISAGEKGHPWGRLELLNFQLIPFESDKALQELNLIFQSRAAGGAKCRYKIPLDDLKTNYLGEFDLAKAQSTTLFYQPFLKKSAIVKDYLGLDVLRLTNEEINALDTISEPEKVMIKNLQQGDMINFAARGINFKRENELIKYSVRIEYHLADKDIDCGSQPETYIKTGKDPANLIYDKDTEGFIVPKNILAVM